MRVDFLVGDSMITLKHVSPKIEYKYVRNWMFRRLISGCPLGFDQKQRRRGCLRGKCWTWV